MIENVLTVFLPVAEDKHHSCSSISAREDTDRVHCRWNLPNQWIIEARFLEDLWILHWWILRQHYHAVEMPILRYLTFCVRDYQQWLHYKTLGITCHCRTGFVDVVMLWWIAYCCLVMHRAVIRTAVLIERSRLTMGPRALAISTMGTASERRTRSIPKRVAWLRCDEWPVSMQRLVHTGAVVALLSWISMLNARVQQRERTHPRVQLACSLMWRVARRELPSNLTRLRNIPSYCKYSCSSSFSSAHVNKSRFCFNKKIKVQR